MRGRSRDCDNDNDLFSQDKVLYLVVEMSLGPGPTPG